MRSVLRVCSSVALGLLLASSAVARPKPVTTPCKAVAAVLIGDSTTNNGTTLNSGGWSNGFCASLADIPKDYCMNEAQNGATTGSTIASGRFDHALGTIRTFVADGRPPFVTVQFGHNDQKIAPPESMGANLTIMVDAIREAGGEPILVTPLTRRNFFENGTINDALKLWADETKRIAELKGTRVIDLLAESIKYCEAIGPDACHVLNRSETDNTHLNEFGMIVFGRIVALLIKGVLPPLHLVKNVELDYNITHGIPSY